MRAATGAYGGSHGGAGGSTLQPGPGDHSGAVYDSAAHPALPGGGGSGTGADDGLPGGGVIIIHAATLTLLGVIEANGGTACMKTSALLPGSDPCGGFAGGGGGGGRVAVAAQHRTKWKGKLFALGGPNFSAEVTKAMRGGAGSVRLSG